MNYEEFLERKSQLGGNHGFDPVFMPDYLFDFQKYLVEWALKKGRSAEFADCGLGKTIMSLVFSQNIVEKTNKNIMILTPLAVAHQFEEEGEKFGIECKKSRDGKIKGKITVTNYQQLERFNPDDFIGVVCDESSAIKNFTGQTKKNVTRFMSKIPYRLCGTATPSPNDFVELGTTSEAIGELPYMDMCAQFFRDTSNDKNPQWSTPKYILKGHAVDDFWRWVSSWARAAKKPSDLGFDDKDFLLPELIETEHIIKCSKVWPGELIPRVATTLKEQRVERKNTITDRINKVSELCESKHNSVIWAHYNYETDLLEKEIKDAVQVSGKDSDEEKEEKFMAFRNGEIKRLVTKPSLGSWGLNWQHCNHMTFFPSHSYEQLYQGIRRCWRFGQKNPVYVDIITTDGEVAVSENIKRKTKDAEIMFNKLIEFMNNSLKINKNNFNQKLIKLPNWL